MYELVDSLTFKLRAISPNLWPVFELTYNLFKSDAVDFLEEMCTFFQIHDSQPPGDVLIFLPGQEDIESLEKAIQLFAHQLPPGHDEVLTVPMYVALSGAQLHRTFTLTPRKTRKCILATNIAVTEVLHRRNIGVVPFGSSKPSADSRCVLLLSILCD
ncbi:hypothetical protein C8F04DRAFT_1062248, partial [Mycena alexandri]